MTGIMGPNGAGKSTLLQAIMGMIPVQQGRIIRNYSRRDIAYLPQQAEIDRTFPIRVLDTVLLGHWRLTGPFRSVSPALRDSALDALAAVGLEGFGKRPIGSLSAGQFQRVLFARVMLQDCRVILLDEPFTAIDARTTADLLALLRRWNTEKRTVIGVLHDIDQVREYFPETLLMARECIAWGNTREVLSESYLKQAKSLSEKWDYDAAVCWKN
ncbi:MAG: metal ABC transporter ATP-binding protein [Fibrobacterota bacterium]|nr:metal ABC transporter ATP-binding protein [Fibrobacterota bacterium]